MVYIYNNQNLKLKRRALRGDMSKPEQIVWYHLKGGNLKNHKFRRQYSVGDYILDFYCPKLRLAIEIDGDSHFVSTSAVVYDQERDEFLARHNINVMHVTNSDVMQNIDGVIEKILQCL